LKPNHRNFSTIAEVGILDQPWTRSDGVIEKML
jgi:hypothetical protein